MPFNSQQPLPKNCGAYLYPREHETRFKPSAPRTSSNIKTTFTQRNAVQQQLTFIQVPLTLIE